MGLRQLHQGFLMPTKVNSSKRGPHSMSRLRVQTEQNFLGFENSTAERQE